jgi:hypothetical protein
MARLLLVLLLLATPALAQEPAPWDAKFYNPKPAPDDLTLPLPCGGAMVFRPIATPAEDTPLADRPMRLGGADQETGYADYMRRAYILGSLAGPDGGRLYYLGKYEVTRDQWTAVIAETCPKPNMGGRRPQSSVSWFDAIDYSRRLTEWLLKNRPDALPDEGDTKAYLRLPTEVEWEYAARGGAAVSEAEFRERLFPMSGDLKTYAWYQGPQSANNQLNPVGLLEPNPLGLYDVLGNVEELVLEPFHMNRVGREHGQPGGFVTKGGSFRDPAARLRTAMRIENPFFDKTTGKATAFDRFGFRLVLAAPVTTSLARTNELKAGWLAATAARVELPEDPLLAVKSLADETTDVEVRARLEAIEELVGTERTRRADLEDRALRSALLTGALLVRSLRDDRNRIELVKVAVESAQRSELTEQLAKYQDQLARAERRYAATIRGYTQTLFLVAEDYKPAQHRAQYDVLVEELERSGQRAELGDDLARFKDVLQAYVLDPGLGEEELTQRAIAR